MCLFGVWGEMGFPETERVLENNSEHVFQKMENKRNKIKMTSNLDFQVN